MKKSVKNLMRKFLINKNLESLVTQVKIKAHQQDIPYQSLIKQYILRGMGIAA